MNAKLAELRQVIRREAKHIGRKPYSHNIVQVALQQIDQEFGTMDANQAIRDFKLARKGFNEVEE
jgi:hypothetical protein